MGRTANILTAVLVILTIAAAVGGGYFVYTTRQNNDLAALPTQVFIPTITPLPPTITPLPTLPPTFTTVPTITPTFTATPTLTPTISPTPTITDTPTPTFTPATTDTPTPTSTFTPSPTSNIPSATPTVTRSPFPFTVRGGQVVFTANTYNQQGCAFQAIAGQVLNERGTGLDGLRIVVTETGTQTDPRSSISGNAGVYGDGGYEVVVDSQINGRTYVVQLESAGGTPVSVPVTVSFPSNCDENVALIYWTQTRPF